MDATTQIWIVIKQSTNLELKTWSLIWSEMLTHSQQQPQVPTARKKSKQSD